MEGRPVEPFGYHSYSFDYSWPPVFAEGPSIAGFSVTDLLLLRQTVCFVDADIKRNTSAVFVAERRAIGRDTLKAAEGHVCLSAVGGAKLNLPSAT